MWHSLPLGAVCHNIAVSRRELHKERTRAAIVEAGIRLFLERGFDQVTVADIAAAADVSPRTFHRYFPDRDELLFAEEAEHRALLRDALAAASFDPDRPLDLLAEVLAVQGARFDGRLDDARAHHRLITANPALRARDLTKRADIEVELAQHLAERLGVAPHTDVRPGLWAQLGLACFFSAYQVWLGQGGELSGHVDRALAALPRTSDQSGSPTPSSRRRGARSVPRGVVGGQSPAMHPTGSPRHSA